MANLSEKLERIENAVDRIRVKVNKPNEEIEEVATAVENMGEGGSGDTNIYRVTSIEERDTIEAKENDMCVVYDVKEFNYDGSNTGNILVFPETIVVDTAITSSATTYLIYGSTSSERIMFQLSATYYRVRDYKTMKYLAQYTSTDGITYTRTSTDEQYVFDSNIQPYSSFNSILTPFVFVKGIVFDGMFTYKEGSWEYTNINSNALDYQIDKNCSVYTNKGTVRGNLGSGNGNSINAIENYIKNMSFSNITDCSNMFNGIDASTSVFINKVSTFDTSNVVDMNHMFYRCTNLNSLSVSNFDTSKVTNMENMFYMCNLLTSLNVSNFDTTNVTNMAGMFRECAKVTTLNLSNFNTANVETMESMFTGCSALSSLNLSSFRTIKVKNMYDMFRGCRKLTSIGVNVFDTSNVTNMGSMFCYCNGLTSLPISNFRTENVEDMSYMFRECNSLTSLTLSSFRTPKLKDMSSMFYDCTKLTSINLSSFNTSNVTNMHSTFSGCAAATTINTSSFDTSNVTKTDYMFRGCSSLTTLDLSNFNTSKVATMQDMFYDCTKLTKLDIRNFDFTGLTSYNNATYRIIGGTTPTSCLIIVKDTATKNWLLRTNASYTNVKTVAEYGA